MTVFLVRRLVNYLFLIFLATSLGWFLASANFTPIDNYAQLRPQPPHALILRLLDERNADPEKPLWGRYIRWLSGVVRGDFGLSMQSVSVNSQFIPRMLITVRLVLVGTVLSAVVGVALGAWAAVRQYKAVDRIITVGSFVLLACPIIVLAILFQIIAVDLNNGLGFKLFNFTGPYDPDVTGFLPELANQAYHLLLPTIVLTLFGAAGYTLYQRNTMLDVLGSDFLRTARAKGLTRGQAIRRHGLRTAVIPVMTLLSYGTVLAFTGSFFIEIVFGWHGLGEYAINAVNVNDVNASAATVAFTAVLVLVAGMLSDIVIAALDPRVRL